MNLWIGLLGMVCILVAFILDEFVKKWNQDTLQYNVLNIVGGGLLVWYASTLGSWPFIILNVGWVVAALVKSGKILKKGLKRKNG